MGSALYLSGERDAAAGPLTDALASDAPVAPDTVKSHIQAVYRKLGVSTRRDAIAKGHDAGIL